jgi:hypothetical protein
MMIDFLDLLAEQEREQQLQDQAEEGHA